MRSHLIPRSVTRPSAAGAPLTQAGLGTTPIRRWDSWYDDELVIRAGENYLADLDDWAIAKLREHRLIWSGFEGGELSAPDYFKFPASNYGVRRIKAIDTNKLRLFFLSLLWRAAATNRWEFSHIVLPTKDLKLLAEKILNANPQPFTFYPIQIVQISTKGEAHNHTPLNDTKHVPAIDSYKGYDVSIVRFYFDGLIVHFHRGQYDKLHLDSQGDLFVGEHSTLSCATVTYENSWQRENLEIIKSEAD